MIGERLKELRTARGLSLRELAAQAGVSATLLSQIERAVTPTPASKPCVGSRACSANRCPRCSPTPRRPPSGSAGRDGARCSRRRRARSPTERLTAGVGQLEVLRAVLQPGQMSADEPRGHASAECVYVVAGALVAQVAGVDYPVRAGESISFDARLPHRYMNASQAPTEIILSVTPPNP